MPPIGEAVEELDLDESMRETLDSIQSDEDAEITPVEDEVEEIEEIEESDSDRDEKGRFKAKAKEAVEEPEVIDDDVVDEGEIVDEDAPDLVNAPDSWTAAAKAKWRDIPEFARAEVHKRENDMRTGVEKMRERASFGDRLNSVIQPYEPIIRAEGATPETVVAEMLNSAYILRSAPAMNKVQLTMQLAHQHGYLNELVATITNKMQNNQQNPVNQALYPLQQEVQQLKQFITQQQQQGQQAEQQAALSEVERFALAKDEEGALIHPHFTQVRTMMASLIELGQATDFESAYETATWSIPELRQVLMAQQAGKKSTKAQEDAKARAERARKAKTVNLNRKGTHDAGSPTKPTGSLTDTMSEVLDDIKNRTG